MSQVAPYGGPVADFLVELFVPRAGAAVDPRDLVERAAAELAAVGTNLIDDGHREHPYGQQVDRRFMGFATVRF